MRNQQKQTRALQQKTTLLDQSSNKNQRNPQNDFMVNKYHKNCVVFTNLQQLGVDEKPTKNIFIGKLLKNIKRQQRF